MTKKKKSSWRADVQRARDQLDALPARAVIVDQYGDAWQCGGVGRFGMFWYRAFDGDGISPIELAQRVGTVTVISGEAIA